MKGRVLVVLSVAAATGLAYLKSVEVLPTRADWSAWTLRDGHISQTFTCNFDSIV